MYSCLIENKKKKNEAELKSNCYRWTAPVQLQKCAHFPGTDKYAHLILTLLEQTPQNNSGKLPKTTRANSPKQLGQLPQNNSGKFPKTTRANSLKQLGQTPQNNSGSLPPKKLAQTPINNSYGFPR